VNSIIVFGSHIIILSRPRFAFLYWFRSNWRFGSKKGT